MRTPKATNMLIDDTGVSCFVDDLGLSCWVDDNGLTLCCGTGSTRRYKHVTFNA